MISIVVLTGFDLQIWLVHKNTSPSGESFGAVVSQRNGALDPVLCVGDCLSCNLSGFVANGGDIIGLGDYWT